MTEPLVCAVMLTKDRPEMAARAVRSFKGQIYENASLLIFDTGGDLLVGYDKTANGLRHVFAHRGGDSIGGLRNRANRQAALDNSEIICHWDDDDFSHPRRIEEQVALLQASGKECVGYHDMLFWETPTNLIPNPSNPSEFLPVVFEGQAWLYQNRSPRYALGTSLCYWRSAWEKRPFPDKNRGEDHEWVYGVDSMGISSLGPSYESDRLTPETMEPRMIASIHAGNGIRVDEKAAHHWSRAAEWDEYARKAMQL